MYVVPDVKGMKWNCNMWCPQTPTTHNRASLLEPCWQEDSKLTVVYKERPRNGVQLMACRILKQFKEIQHWLSPSLKNMARTRTSGSFKQMKPSLYILQWKYTQRSNGILMKVYLKTTQFCALFFPMHGEVSACMCVLYMYQWWSQIFIYQIYGVKHCYSCSCHACMYM